MKIICALLFCCKERQIDGQKRNFHVAATSIHVEHFDQMVWLRLLPLFWLDITTKKDEIYSLKTRHFQRYFSLYWFYAVARKLAMRLQQPSPTFSCAVCKCTHFTHQKLIFHRVQLTVTRTLSIRSKCFCRSFSFECLFCLALFHFGGVTMSFLFASAFFVEINFELILSSSGERQSFVFVAHFFRFLSLRCDFLLFFYYLLKQFVLLINVILVSEFFLRVAMFSFFSICLSFALARFLCSTDFHSLHFYRFAFVHLFIIENCFFRFRHWPNVMLNFRRSLLHDFVSIMACRLRRQSITQQKNFHRLSSAELPQFHFDDDDVFTCCHSNAEKAFASREAMAASRRMK